MYSSMVSALESAPTLALKFGVELAAIASLAYWGASLDGSLLSAVMMVFALCARRDDRGVGPLRRPKGEWAAVDFGANPVRAHVPAARGCCSSGCGRACLRRGHRERRSAECAVADRPRAVGGVTDAVRSELLLRGSARPNGRRRRTWLPHPGSSTRHPVRRGRRRPRSQSRCASRAPSRCSALRVAARRPTATRPARAIPRRYAPDWSSAARRPSRTRRRRRSRPDAGADE